ncbi:MAG: hypothetical protein IPI67_31460 [Myxococcales bacterium]|nr:hypothetical protein [Myxococcales bacterium]
MARTKQLAAFAVVVCAVGGAFAWRSRPVRPIPLVLERGARALETDSRVIIDPVSPERPAFALAPRDEAFQGTAARAVDDTSWVVARPDPAHRHERTAAERGGVDPCALPKATESTFGAWQSISSRGYVAFPEAQAVDTEGNFDTLLIFNGHDVAWTMLAEAKVPIVLFGTTLRDYRGEYGGPEALDQLLAAVEQVVSKSAGRAAHARHVALAAWSAGYDAISILLERSPSRDRVDGVVLLDGLHCSRDREMMPKQLGPFLRFAERAVDGKAFMFVSHSSVDTDGFASTTETMHFLALERGGRPLAAEREDALGLQLIEIFDRGDFHLRGYAGGGKRDHCAQLGLYPVAARALARRWQAKAKRDASGSQRPPPDEVTR